MNLDFKIRGRYKLAKQTVHEDGTVGPLRDVTPWGDNLITNAGMNYLGTAGTTNCFTNLRVGAGSTPPAVTDTALVSTVANVNSTSSSLVGWDTTSVPGYAIIKMQRTFTFAKGAAAGNLTEIGLAPSVNENLATRCLIKDSSGNPITVTVLANEILTVYYQMWVYQPTTDAMQNFTGSDGVARTITSRPYGVGTPGADTFIGNLMEINNLNWNNGAGCTYTADKGLQAVTSSRPSLDINIIAGSRGAYTVDTHYIDYTFSFDINTANSLTPGLNFFIFDTNYGHWQTKISPGIAKNNTKSMTIVFRFSWSRYAT